MSLLKQASIGLREMPSNAARLFSRAFASNDAVGSAAEGAASRAREQGWRLSEAIGDAIPGGSDSIQVQMRRAQEAADDARRTEQQAVEAAREAKERSDHALQVSERGRAQMKEAEREAARASEQRVRQAERDAADLVKRERLAAGEDADRRWRSSEPRSSWPRRRRRWPKRGGLPTRPSRRRETLPSKRARTPRSASIVVRLLKLRLLTLDAAITMLPPREAGHGLTHENGRLRAARERVAGGPGRLFDARDCPTGGVNAVA